MVRPGLDEFCNVLLRTGCIKFGTFQLSSGALSPYYVDLRLIPSDPEAFKRAIGFYTVTLERVIKRSSRLVGIPTAGVPYAAVLAFNFAKPFLYLRREAKDHGQRRRIEGIIFPGDKVVLLDDVITTGKNIIEAVDTIRAEGGVVKDAVVLLDRQQGGKAQLMKMGVRLRSYATITRVAKVLLKRGTIDDEQYSEILLQVTD
ncbi:MAG TPA: orotate phosphoribosyltransferase [Candidatus Bathyarchaeia archaeon]|nr:orotate phosphoribosyltransferase [Candidatus Bathyarchaeia archaeon]